MTAPSPIGEASSSSFVPADVASVSQAPLDRQTGASDASLIQVGDLRFDRLLTRRAKGKGLAKPAASQPKEQGKEPRGALSLISLPLELLTEIALQVDLPTRRAMRLTCSALEVAASNTIQQVVVRSREDLAYTLAVYQEGKPIQKLIFQGSDFTAEDLKNLPPQVQSLDLSACRSVTDDWLEHLPKGLQHLNLAGCDFLTNYGLRHLPAGLQQLDLTGCDSITNDGLQYLPRKLQHLNLAGKLITRYGLESLPKGLRHLNLAGCNYISNGELASLPEGLQYLDLTGCDLIDDEGLESLPAGLRHLNLAYCNRLSNAGLQHLAEMSTPTEN